MSAALNIFDLGDELDRIALAYDQLEDSGTDQEFLDAVEAYFADLLEARDEKLDRYARLIKSCQAKAKERKKESDRLAALANADENLAERLKERLKLFFEANGIQRIETTLHKFNVQGNGGVQALLLDESLDPAELPEEYRVVTVEADKEAIRRALDAGEALTFARLAPRGTHVRIR